jgi:hypothetical protein
MEVVHLDPEEPELAMDTANFEPGDLLELKVASTAVHDVNGLASVDLPQHMARILIALRQDLIERIRRHDRTMGAEQLWRHSCANSRVHLRVGRREDVAAEVHRLLKLVLRKSLACVGCSLDDRTDDVEGAIEVVLVHVGENGGGLVADLLVGSHDDEEEAV